MRWLKEAIKDWLGRYGYEIRRAQLDEVRPFPLLTMALRAYLYHHQPPFLLQIGANDGKLSDPVHELILAHHLPGLLVEPLPDMFTTLLETYAGEFQLRFEQCAIGSTDGPVTMYRFRREAPVPDWAHGMASMSRQHLAKFADLLPHQKEIETATVPGMTIKSLLAKHGNPEVRLLQVDAEGFDFMVIQQALLSGLRPDLIHYENQHLAATDHAACHALLRTAGYDFLDHGKNTLAVRSGVLRY